MKDTSPQCTLTDIELLEVCQKAISAQSEKGHWPMNVPPDMNRDSDMVLSELHNRYKKACQEPALGNATTHQLLHELVARLEKHESASLLWKVEDMLNAEQLKYRTNDQPLTARSRGNAAARADTSATTTAGLPFEELKGVEMFVWVAPDGAPQPPTMCPDFPLTIAVANLLAEAGIGKSAADMMKEGFNIFPVTVTIKQNGTPEDAFQRAKQDM